MGMITQKEEPMKFNRRFAAHFRYDDDTKKYVPTMACIDSKDEYSLRVRCMTSWIIEHLSYSDVNEVSGHFIIM